MKKIIILIAVFTLLVAGVAYAGVIKASKHDLSTSGTGTVKATTETEICVFCHAPHFAVASPPAPLWNLSIAPGPFTPYGTTVGGTVISASPTGSTLACMSCHDGVTAVNKLYNIPGSTVGGTIAMAASVLDADGSLLATSNGNLGTDLKDDHPVSFVYDGSKASLRALTGTGTIAKVTGATVVEGTAATAKMECASCHSVHDPAFAPFLRLANASSGLCLACHIK